MHKVRVIMITFQGERFIREQLDSIVNQEALESIHIYDDNSNPRFYESLQTYAHQADVSIHVEQNSKNLGVIRNIQQALSAHQDAEYIALADQDDLWYPNKLKVTLAALKGIEEPKLPCLAYHDVHMIDAEGQLQGLSFWESQRQAHYHHNFETSLISNVVSGAASLMNRAMIPYVLDLRQGLPIYHDAWMGMSAFAMGKTIRLNTPLSAHRMHQKSLTFDRQPKANLKEKVVRNWKHWIEKAPMFEDQFTAVKAFIKQYEHQIPASVKTSIETFLRLEDQGFWAQKRYIHNVQKRIRN